MKRRLATLVFVGVMVMSCISASAETRSASKSGYLGSCSVTGVVVADNVNNTAKAILTTSQACGLDAQAVIVYNNGSSAYSGHSIKYGTDCTASIQKPNVHVEGGRGIFSVEKDPYVWKENVSVEIK